MQPERIKAIHLQFPWLPDDYLRVLSGIEAGQRRYGLEWFDGPQRPADMGGPSAAQSFPSAFRIGRRNGQFVGYEYIEGAHPALREWGGSQQQVSGRYAGINELILSQRDPWADQRPIVKHAFGIPGMAFGSWHDAGTCLVADCILSPGLETEGLNNLLDRLAAEWELTLVRSDNDSWLSVRRGEHGLELLDARHGSVGDWRAASRESALSELAALAPYNSGGIVQYFGSMSLPKPA